MEKHLLLNLFFASLICCLDKTQSSRVGTTNERHAHIYADKTVTLFGDSSYKLTLHIFDTLNYNQETRNAVLTFSKQEKNYEKVFFRDSMYCLYPGIDFKDFNNDKIKDVLIFYYTGARANPTYHLYLTDLKNRKLIRVRGFEELPNPDLDTTNNIIISIALSGTNYYSFYRINKVNKLVNLGYGFNENPGESNQYERTIRKIKKVK
ncbi:MAG: hypothetical protein Q8941_21550 [Bacteroidota bacterium]|nr:hypothetical protein [Bacteroidota bacterium]